MTLSKRKVLVSGGSGFIGSHLVKRLLVDDAEVALPLQYDNVVKNERLQWCWDRLQVIEADLRNRGALEAVASSPPKWCFT